MKLNMTKILWSFQKELKVRNDRNTISIGKTLELVKDIGDAAVVSETIWIR